MMKVRVTTVDVATGKQRGESKVINYDRPNARKWLASHCLWAYNNGFGVATCNVADEAK